MRFVAGRDFRLDTRALMTQVGHPLPSREFDLLRLGMAVYVTDRLIRREVNHAYDGPSREMTLSVSLADPDFWAAPAVKELIVEALELISDDAWFLSFQPLDEKFEFQGLVLEPLGPIESVFLYSAGLDSAAGLAARLSRGGCGSIVAVTAQHQAGQRKRVYNQLRAMQRAFGRAIPSIIVPTTLMHAPRMSEQELTQRCRGFLFACLAGVVAIELGASTVEVFENGIGALNLPPMAGMLVGGRSTKNCHPHFLRLMSELVSVIAKRPIEFVLPFRDLTKAELVKSLSDGGQLAEVARATVSCVHFPLHANQKQCGVCPGCIGRRQAMRLAGIDDPAGAYQYDIFGSRSEVDCIPATAFDDLRAMLMQVDDLRGLSLDNMPLLIRSHLRGTRVIEQDEDARPWLMLLQRYRDEWIQLLDGARLAGCGWAKWFPGRPIDLRRAV